MVNCTVLLRVLEWSKLFQNVLECSRMFQYVPVHSRMFDNVLYCHREFLIVLELDRVELDRVELYGGTAFWAAVGNLTHSD